MEMIKTLAGQIKSYWKASIATPLYMLLEVAMETIIPMLMASIIDDGVNVEGGNIRHICIVGGIMVVIAAIGLFAGVMGGKYGAYASAGFAKNLRQSMYEHIQTFSFSNIDKFSTAGLVTRMTTDVTNIQNAYMMLLRMGMRAPASLICAMVAAYMISAKVANIYLAAVLILSGIIVVIIFFAMKYFNQVFKKYDDMNASIQENVSAIRVVKAYVREDYETDKFQKTSKRVYDMFVKAESIIAVNMPVMMATVFTCILLISWMGAKLIVAGDLTTGNLMSLLAYCMNILMSLMMLSMTFVMITMSMASAKRITEVIKEETDIKNPESPVKEVKHGGVTFDQVNFAYKADSQEYVLKNINLDIAPGETIGIIGGTGSAKSSLVNLISRLYDVQTGSVSVGGVDVRQYDLQVLRDEVSVVLQKNTLFSGTIYDNLRWGNAAATEEECQEACRLACADEFIHRLPDGYNTMIEQGGTNVSGGQRQRLCIARALLKKPKILILDDSTSAVDTATDAKIRQAFAQEIPDTTKIIIAQRISSVEHADRIVVMHEGEIDGVGTHEELLANNQIYSEVYASQNSANGDFDEEQSVGGEYHG